LLLGRDAFGKQKALDVPDGRAEDLVDLRLELDTDGLLEVIRKRIANALHAVAAAAHQRIGDRAGEIGDRLFLELQREQLFELRDRLVGLLVEIDELFPERDDARVAFAGALVLLEILDLPKQLLALLFRLDPKLELLPRFRLRHLVFADQVHLELELANAIGNAPLIVLVIARELAQFPLELLIEDRVVVAAVLLDPFEVARRDGERLSCLVNLLFLLGHLALYLDTLGRGCRPRHLSLQPFEDLALLLKVNSRLVQRDLRAVALKVRLPVDVLAFVSERRGVVVLLEIEGAFDGILLQLERVIRIGSFQVRAALHGVNLRLLGGNALLRERLERHAPAQIRIGDQLLVLLLGVGVHSAGDAQLDHVVVELVELHVESCVDARYRVRLKNQRAEIALSCREGARRIALGADLRPGRGSSGRRRAPEQIVSEAPRGQHRTCHESRPAFAIVLPDLADFFQQRDGEGKAYVHGGHRAGAFFHFTDERAPCALDGMRDLLALLLDCRLLLEKRLGHVLGAEQALVPHALQLHRGHAEAFGERAGERRVVAHHRAHFAALQRAVLESLREAHHLACGFLLALSGKF
jgi:hypothetical protein